LVAKAVEAVEEAQSMPPGPERTAALKEAGMLQNAAETYGILLSRELTPPT